MKISTIFFLMLALLPSVGIPANGSDTAPVTQIASMLSKPALLCGKFDQIKQIVGMKKPLASSGRFCVERGTGVLWRTLTPFASTMRLTRDEIVQYQGDRLASRLDAAHEPVVRTINGVLFSLLSGDLSQLSSLFVIDAKVRGKEWNVALKAREPALAKAIGDIALDGDQFVRTVRITEAGGDKTTISFSQMQTGEAAMTPEEAKLL
jgi:hypothetical protein